MAPSLMEFRRPLIHETGPVSKTSAQCHIVPGMELTIFPNSLHMCRERQNEFALEERAVDPGHQRQYLQLSQ